MAHSSLQDDDDNYTEVAGSEFTIARVANKSSNSTYYINDKAASFKVLTRALWLIGRLNLLSFAGSL